MNKNKLLAALKDEDGDEVEMYEPTTIVVRTFEIGGEEYECRQEYDQEDQEVGFKVFVWKNKKFVEVTDKEVVEAFEEYINQNAY